MNRHGMNRLPVALVLVGAAACLSLASCDKEVSSSKKTTTSTSDTPQGTTKTTETTEKKVEVDPK